MAKDIDFSMATVGAPVEGGCVFTSFAQNPTLPTDAVTDVSADFQSLGEISENGFTISNELSSTDIKGWHRKVILTTIDEEKKSFKLEFVEVNRLAVAQLRYGVKNVVASTNGETYEVVKDKGIPTGTVPFVIDELESNGYKRRYVFPKCQITSIDEESHKASSLVTFGITFNVISVEGNEFGDIYRAKPADDDNASGGSGAAGDSGTTQTASTTKTTTAKA